MQVKSRMRDEQKFGTIENRAMKATRHSVARAKGARTSLRLLQAIRLFAASA
jgi:hypothetical protein